MFESCVNGAHSPTVTSLPSHDPSCLVVSSGRQTKLMPCYWAAHRQQRLSLSVSVDVEMRWRFISDLGCRRVGLDVLTRQSSGKCTERNRGWKLGINENHWWEKRAALRMDFNSCEWEHGNNIGLTWFFHLISKPFWVVCWPELPNVAVKYIW